MSRSPGQLRGSIWWTAALVALSCTSEPCADLPDGKTDNTATDTAWTDSAAVDCSALKETPSNVQDWCGQGEYLVDSDRRLVGRIVSKAGLTVWLQECRTGVRFRIRTSNCSPERSADSWITAAADCKQPVGQDLASMNAPLDWAGMLTWSDNFKAFLEPITVPRAVTVTAEIWDSMLGGGCDALAQPVSLASAYGVQIALVQPKLPNGPCVTVTLKDAACLPKGLGQ